MPSECYDVRNTPLTWQGPRSKGYGHGRRPSPSTYNRTMPTSFNAGRLALATTLALTLLGFARMSFANDAALVADAKHTIGVFKKTAPGIDKFFRNSAG